MYQGTVRMAAVLAMTVVLSALWLSPPAWALECAACHRGAAAALQDNRHGAALGLDSATCQSCHGEASAHADNPVAHAVPHRFGANVPAAKRDEICLGCHQTEHALGLWASGLHKAHEVACASCHQVHHKRVDSAISAWTTTTRASSTPLCLECHKEKQVQLHKLSRHPVAEGKMTCTDCHNPHGTLSPAMVRADTVNDLCLGCHADKRGPFMWAHAPVEENCLNCHNPHGSNHLKLLTEKAPTLCQDCHDGARHPGSFYGGDASFAPGTQNTRFVARSCVNCHQLVHGSNAPGARGQFFLR